VAQRERATTPSDGGVFVAHSQPMDADDVRRALWRMAHEVVEHNHGSSQVAVVGLQTGGVPLAEQLAKNLAEVEGRSADLGVLDVAFHRDDIGLRPVLQEAPTSIPFDLNDRIVVLVDDVLFTGRTIRAALDALVDFGRPQAVQLAVMIDRGHRELPIRPDYVGKNLPTRRDELVDVTLDGVALGKFERSEAPEGGEAQP
jgi:pyrimidine operon attenuation protein/uracil phosphoribosyltransferase